ncbi:TPA: CHAT domain-containing protein, partial [bacterium]|nr:CHAT domain-containing protein [bacterium]
SKHKEANLKTFDASDANKLKLFFAEHNHTPFEIIIYYGHAVFGSDHSTTGLLCKDNSIFSIEDCEVFESAPCKCMIVNACQSARGNIFEKNSFAYAALKAGVDTYIGTHFFLESQRSKLFVQTFLESIIHGKSFFEAFNDSYNTLKQKFGPYDVSTYNYVYYGN